MAEESPRPPNEDAAGAGAPCGAPPEQTEMKPPLRMVIALGLLAAVGMFAAYVGILTSIESWGHALRLLHEDAAFVGFLSQGSAPMGLSLYHGR